MKFSVFRYLSGTGQVNWATDPIYLAVLSSYTFDEDHATLGDIQLAGGVVVSTASVPGREVDVDGWARSLPVTVPVVPAGTYDLLLMKSEGADFLPIVHFDAAAVAGANGDLIVRPEESTFVATGKWFRF